MMAGEAHMYFLENIIDFSVNSSFHASFYSIVNTNTCIYHIHSSSSRCCFVMTHVQIKFSNLNSDLYLVWKHQNFVAKPG